MNEHADQAGASVAAQPTAGMLAYAAWHGMTIAHVQDEWAQVPQADKMRAKWEAVGEAVECAERERCAKIVDLPPGTEAWEVIGGEEGLTMLRELAAQIRGA